MIPLQDFSACSQGHILYHDVVNRDPNTKVSYL